MPSAIPTLVMWIDFGCMQGMTLLVAGTPTHTSR
jgi:hypothetical protein